jgi:hypothetical protein
VIRAIIAGDLRRGLMVPVGRHHYQWHTGHLRGARDLLVGCATSWNARRPGTQSKLK